MKVPLLDLKAQYVTIRDEIRQAVEEVLESQRFILGPEVEALEDAVAAYCGCDHAVGVSSGTDALLIALMVGKIGYGHGVITTPFTFFATAGSIVRAGASPFFVDIDPVTYNIDSEAIEAFIKANCSLESDKQGLIHKESGTGIWAIIPVHLYGQCADMGPITKLAREYNLWVIEDGAQAIGAEYPSEDIDTSLQAGSLGHFGCFSFFPSKNLGGIGDGGMVTTNDSTLAEELRVVRVHGSKPKYYHHLVGGNFRLDAIQAAVLRVKLKYLDDWTAKRRQNAAYYDSLFQHSGMVDRGLIIPPRAIWDELFSKRDSNPQSEIRNPKLIGHIYNQYVIRARKRDELKAYLNEQGIGTEIYYPLPLHQQKCFQGLGYRAGDFPESERAAAETLALPVYPELEPAKQEYIVEKVSAFYKGKQ